MLLMPGRKTKRLWLGAGLLGAAALALRYAIRPPTKSPVPDVISPREFTTRVAHTSRGQIVYHEGGAGQTVVFVHGIGIGASSYEWSKVYPAFAGQCRVLAPDLLGFGESQRPRAALNADEHVRSLSEFIRATCGTERVILVGTNLGGGFSVQVASQHPELVSRLVLLMPTGFTEFRRRRRPAGLARGMGIPVLNRFLYRNYLSRKPYVRSWLDEFGVADPASVTDEMVEVFTTCAQQYGAEHAIFNFYRGKLDVNLLGRFTSLTQPVALLWAHDARLAPLEWAYHLCGLNPRCRLLILHECGVLAPLEKADTVTEALRQELDGSLREFRAG